MDPHEVMKNVMQTSQTSQVKDGSIKPASVKELLLMANKGRNSIMLSSGPSSMNGSIIGSMIGS